MPNQIKIIKIFSSIKMYKLIFKISNSKIKCNYWQAIKYFSSGSKIDISKYKNSLSY